MNETQRCIFSGMKMLYDHKWVTDHALIVEDHRIKAVIPASMIAHHLPARQITFPANFMMTPGFIDVHIHGANGKDVMDDDPNALAIISAALAAEGVTGFLATTMTAQSAQIEKILKNIQHAMSSEHGAAVLGAHLEGPFIAKFGAQNAQHACLPERKTIERWLNAVPNVIKKITLAPELPGALHLIPWLHSHNMTVSIGHTHATYAETEAAITAGCSQATHLFNAMTGMHQREPGAAGALLLSDLITAELIVDGVHLHPAMVDLALRVKTKERILLVTDAMRAKCLEDGEYELGGQTVQVKAQQARLEDGTLAGSTLTMPVAIQNMVRFTKCSLIDAIAMATSMPAQMLDLSATKGDLSVGKDADLVVLDSQFAVKMTVRAGKIIYEHQ